MAIPVSRFLQDQQIIRHPQNPETPLVSVCMPTYRLRPRGTNRRAIESVLGQTFSDFEFIIVDDGSLDGLYPFLLEYQQRDPRIVVVRHEINSGLPGLRTNEAILLARGKYIAYMFEDDEWYPNALESMLATAEQNPGECAVYGTVDWVIQRPDGHTENKKLGAWDFNYSLLKNQNYLANCAVLHPRSIMDVCGMYDPHILLRRSCDYDLWLRMGRKIQFRRCHEVVGKVTSAAKYTLGSSVDLDFVVTSRFLPVERDEKLLPTELANYVVDSLDLLSTAEERHRIHERYIVPFWQQHPRLLTPGEQKLVLTSRAQPNRLLVTKGDYSTSVDVTLGNFSRRLSPFTLSLSYIQERSLMILRQWDFDTLVLYRTIGGESIKTLAQAHLWDKPIIYLMDDNMFKFGTGYLAEEFSYLTPGAPAFKNLVQEVSEADLVISYSPVITRDCKDYNPRTLELSTNIRESRIIDVEPIPGGRASGRRLKYAILTGSARKEELALLWGVFQEFGRRHRDEIEYYVWGIDPSKFGPLEAPVFYKEFNFSYDAYLQALKEEQFDYILCPLFDDHDSKISKSPIKYLEATAASAVGIYSDVEVYRAVSANVTGLKASNQPEAWLEVLEDSFQKTDAERNQMLFAAKAHILRTFTSESQVLRFLSVFEAAQLHRSLHSRTAANGRAVIAYFFHESFLGGATMHLMQHALMLRRYGFQPIFCFMQGLILPPEIQRFANQHEIPIEQLDFRYFVFPLKVNNDERQAISRLRDWMTDHDVRFVHTVTYMPEVAQAAHELGIPCLATLHQYYDDYYDAPPEYSPLSAQDEKMVSVIHSSSLRYAEKWQTALEVPAFCIRAPIATSYFDQFAVRETRQTSEVPTLLVSGTLQPRKGQLHAIRALGNLRDRGISFKLVLLGYDNLFPEYVEECRQAIEQLGLQELVSIPGFTSSPQSFYDEADYILCSSGDESMPQSVLIGMAAGIRVITAPAGGVKELIIDGFSGIIAHGFDVEDLQEAIERALSLSESHWQTMLENAHLAARMSCAQDVVENKLLGLYNLALQERKKSYPSYAAPRMGLATSAQVPEQLSAIGRMRGATRQVGQRAALLRDRALLKLSRSGKLVELAKLLVSQENLENQMAPGFKSLQEDSYKFSPSLKGHLLQPSALLNRLEFVEYRYEFRRPNLQAVSISPILTAPAKTGILGLEIVSPQGRIVTQVICPLSEVDGTSPFKFSFDPISGTDMGTWLIRIFVRDSDVPVRICEWKKANLWQRELISRKGFMAFSFDESGA